MGFVRDSMCRCLFTRGEVVIFDFVNDFLVCGEAKDLVSKVVVEYKRLPPQLSQSQIRRVSWVMMWSGTVVREGWL
jgi:hypothetical protein